MLVVDWWAERHIDKFAHLVMVAEVNEYIWVVCLCLLLLFSVRFTQKELKDTKYLHLYIRQKL